jgi:hypothetical protein
MNDVEFTECTPCQLADGAARGLNVAVLDSWLIYGIALQIASGGADQSLSGSDRNVQDHMGTTR